MRVRFALVPVFCTATCGCTALPTQLHGCCARRHRRERRSPSRSRRVRNQPVEHPNSQNRPSSAPRSTSCAWTCRSSIAMVEPIQTLEPSDFVVKEDGIAANGRDGAVLQAQRWAPERSQGIDRDPFARACRGRSRARRCAAVRVVPGRLPRRQGAADHDSAAADAARRSSRNWARTISWR